MCILWLDYGRLNNQAGLSKESKAYPEPQELFAYAEFGKAT